ELHRQHGGCLPGMRPLSRDAFSGSIRGASTPPSATVVDDLSRLVNIEGAGSEGRSGTFFARWIPSADRRANARCGDLRLTSDQRTAGRGGAIRWSPTGGCADRLALAPPLLGRAGSRSLH